MQDIILTSGKIIDGSGQKPYFSDVAVKDGKITMIGDLKNIQAKTTLN